jgi:hypothetical protein
MPDARLRRTREAYQAEVIHVSPSVVQNVLWDDTDEMYRREYQRRYGQFVTLPREKFRVVQLQRTEKDTA